MRLQLISILLAATTIFLLPEMGYSENNSTQNLALGYSYEGNFVREEADGISGLQDIALDEQAG